MADGHHPRPVRLAFEPDGVELALGQLIPLKAMRPGIKDSKKYQQICGSIQAIGLVEAPVVARNPADPNTFFLLDGHLRVEALRDLGTSRIECLVSTDDETYTYNKQVNRLAPVQEHKMIMRAMARGVSEAAIAEALGLDAKSIARRTRLLNGICPEAVDLLKDMPCPLVVFDILRRMTALRQVEVVELMVGQNNFTLQFARVLLASTLPVGLVTPRRSEKASGHPSPETMARLERELASLQSQAAAMEDTYGPDMLHLTVARAYIKKLVANPRVVEWLSQNKKEYLSEFQGLVEADV